MNIFSIHIQNLQYHDIYFSFKDRLIDKIEEELSEIKDDLAEPNPRKLSEKL